jgi:putative methyltransferase
LAFDKDARRLKLLEANAARAGADRIIAAERADFLSLGPGDERFAGVRAIILDPSCSGSGTGVSRMDHLLPQPQGAVDEADEGGAGGEAAAEARRVEALARFQEAALRHVLRFPNARRVAYSTCSVHRRENEDVVAAVLPAAAAAGFELADALPVALWPRRGIPGSLPNGLARRVVRTDAALDGTDGFFVALFVRKRQKQQEDD